MRAETDHHLLPASANAPEKALSLAVRFGTDILPEDIKTLWQPQEAAARFLPFIAWGLHVDFWRDTLFEQAKRNLIADSYEWHRIEGTFGAIRRICDAVFGKTQVQAWYEYGGEPYGFRVSTDGKFSAPEEWEVLIEAIWFAQALRDSLDGLDIYRNVRMELYHGAALSKSGEKRLGLPPLPPKTARAFAGVGVVRGGQKQVNLHHRTRIGERLHTGAFAVKSGTKTIGPSEADTRRLAQL